MKTLKKIWKDKELRKKILITFTLIAFIRLMASITLPGIRINSLAMGDETTTLLSLINMLGGGNLEQFSILALGVSPYITASIVVELLSMDVIPAFTQWRKEGASAKKKINRANTVVTLILCLIQSSAILYAFDKSYGILEVSTLSSYAFLVLLMTAGTMIAVYIGNKITQKGIGNGVSLIIFTGIVSSLPTHFLTAFDVIVTYKNYWTFAYFGLFILAYLAIVYFVVHIENSFRNIPIQYAGANISGKQKQYFPIKLNPSGVIPVIFASSLLVAPRVVVSFLKPNEWTEAISYFCDYTKPVGLFIYIALIFAFSYFYSHIQIDGKKIADDLRKNGGSIPGVRAGEDTTKYIKKTLNRVNFFGALALLFIAVIPIVLPMCWKDLNMIGIQIGGTSLIIMSSVALETVKKIESSISSKKYTVGNYSMFRR